MECKYNINKIDYFNLILVNWIKLILNFNIIKEIIAYFNYRTRSMNTKGIFGVTSYRISLF